MAPARVEKSKPARYAPSATVSNTNGLLKTQNTVSQPSNEDYLTSPVLPKRKNNVHTRKSRSSLPPKDPEYLCVRTLAFGASGDVLLVRKTQDPSCVYAVKASRKSAARRFEWDYRNDKGLGLRLGRDEKNRERQILTELPWSPWVAGLVDAFSDRRNLYLTLELGECGSFNNYLAHRALSTEDCRFYFANIVCAINFIHSYGIVHRDIKPENILMCGDGYLMLTDFGNSQMLTSQARWYEAGTLNYVSPDCLGTSCPASIATSLDWWSAGCILFEMASGRPAFPLWSPYNAETIESLRQQIKTATYGWPDPSAIDEVLRELVDEMLECSIEDRFAPLSINAGQPGKIANPEMYYATFLVGNDDNRKFIDDVVSRNIKPPFIPSYLPDLTKSWFTEGVPFQEEIPGIPILTPPVEQTFDIRTRPVYNRPDKKSDLYPDRDPSLDLS